LPHLVDHVAAGVREQPGDAVEQQHRVLGEDHTHGYAFHGMSAVRTVPSPGGLWRNRSPSTASTRSASPWSPVPARGSAPPRPLSVTVTRSRSPRRRRTRSARTVTAAASACLATLVSASHTT